MRSPGDLSAGDKVLARKAKEKAKVYFPSLHGLRFFAAMLVVFSHIELMKDYHGYPNLYASNLAVYESGRMGVTLFFVLSGFLISYLLLTEKKVSGTIRKRRPPGAYQISRLSKTAGRQ